MSTRATCTDSRPYSTLILVVSLNVCNQLSDSVNRPAESLIRSALRPRLTCLAAGALARSGRTYNPRHVPRVLHSFLSMHGVPSTDHIRVYVPEPACIKLNITT
ncbi:Feminization 1-like protein [Operophtera brumata]|uniref:Feminization 1-like protein n=1 Tax=Operophtera brumata TaxID=104452 RepID=A0A0L7LBS5_OPEBR|nr:Feminization 1-like protein [Operophtera brumata]